MRKFNLSGQAFIIHKLGEDYKGCHDRFCINEQERRFAIADGVSNSFFPAMWADLLVKDFCQTGFGNGFSIEESRKSWLEEMINRCKDQWYKEVSRLLEKGMPFYTRNKFNMRESAAATIVALEFDSEEIMRWKLFCLGDSYFFLFDRDLKMVEAHSSQLDGKTFDNYPDYLDSYKGLVRGKPQWREGVGEEANTILMVTDALAEWIFYRKDRPEELEQIFKVKNKEEFIEFVKKEKKKDVLKDDDITLVRIDIGKEYSDGFLMDNMDELIQKEEDDDESKKESSSQEKMNQSERLGNDVIEKENPDTPSSELSEIVENKNKGVVLNPLI